ncbi:hypothetical protein PBY51_002381 [Eleginops maclovinus]|uniref:Uncharacterized protein n=1 Tax=Eleginops maclovinus TaxID=56733 RepID=A0AAN8AJA8_ELEMC|nr:hypothetical protein PBY51_002381 [Eleginops maclovinus]
MEVQFQSGGRGEISTPPLPVSVELPPPGPPHKSDRDTGRGHTERLRTRQDRQKKAKGKSPTVRRICCFLWSRGNTNCNTPGSR